MPPGIYKHAPCQIVRMRDQILAADDDCLEWPGSMGAYGYGICWYLGKSMNAQRAAYHVFHGKFPDNFACHHCDNRRCINPRHLFDGDQLANMQDAVRKGRIPRGAKNGAARHAKINPDDVFRLAAGGMGPTSIARSLGISQPYAGRILRGLRRNHAATA